MCRQRGTALPVAGSIAFSAGDVRIREAVVRISHVNRAKHMLWSCTKVHRQAPRCRRHMSHVVAATAVTSPPRRTVHCAEALAWLEEQESLPNVLTSLPDITEIAGPPLNVRDAQTYREFLVTTTALITRKLRPGCVALFCQTNSLFAGTLIDKAHCLTAGALSVGAPQLWHKILLRSDVGTIKPGKLPGWSSLLAYASPLDAGDTQLHARGPAFPDVFHRGDTAWSRAIGVDAALAACKFIKGRGGDEVLDMFCGTGTVLAAANHIGLSAVGVDLSPKRVRHAKVMELMSVDGALVARRTTDRDMSQLEEEIYDDDDDE